MLAQMPPTPICYTHEYIRRKRVPIKHKALWKNNNNKRLEKDRPRKKEEN